MEIIYVTGATFEEEVLKEEKPVLVDFWATWCGPCKMLAPILEEVAGETDSVKICKIDVDENQDSAMQYRVMSVPTLILFKNGVEVARSSGLLSKTELIDFINQ